MEVKGYLRLSIKYISIYLKPCPFQKKCISQGLHVFPRWSEVTRKLEFWVQILEQNENGEYCPVEVIAAKDVPTGGIFQLRQVPRL